MAEELITARIAKRKDRKMTYILGLTGGIATGKSTVSDILEELGAKIIDADQVSRQVVDKGQEGLKKVHDHFGDQVIKPDGQLDRQALANVIFVDTSKREELNDILHPIIRQEIIRQKDQLMASNPACIVLDIPLLFEAGYDHECDGVMVVTTPRPIQKLRLMERNNLSEYEAQSRIDSQMSLGKKIDRADFVVDNSKTVEETKQQVEDWYHNHI